MSQEEDKSETNLEKDEKQFKRVETFVLSAAAILFIALFIIYGLAALGVISVGGNRSTTFSTFAQFGDYMGGTINPFLAFLTVFLLVRSIGLQLKELKNTTGELSLTRKAHEDSVNNQRTQLYADKALFELENKKNELISVMGKSFTGSANLTLTSLWLSNFTLTQGLGSFPAHPDTIRDYRHCLSRFLNLSADLFDILDKINELDIPYWVYEKQATEALDRFFMSGISGELECDAHHYDALQKLYTRGMEIHNRVRQRELVKITPLPAPPPVKKDLPITNPD